MKMTVASLLVVLMVGSSMVQGAPQQPSKLTQEQKDALAKLDDIDINEELKDKEIVERRIACVLDEVTCEGDDVVAAIRVLIPVGMQSDGCRSCTSQERGKLLKTAKNIKYQHPERYQQLLDKYNNGEEPPELEAL